MVICALCNNEFKSITNVHLKIKHDISFNEYRTRFPDAELGEWYTKILNSNRDKEKNFLRSKKVVDSRIKHGTNIAWNKGLIKEIDPRVSSGPWTEERKLKRINDYATGKIVIWNKGLFGDPRLKWSDSVRKKMLEKYILGWLPNYFLGRGLQGYRDDLNHFVRSSWEANICRIFKYLHIEYEYESEKCRFNLGDSIYTCDWYLPEFNMYIECKGYLYQDSLNKLKKVHALFPDIIFKVIDFEVYRIFTERYSKLIPKWETYKRRKM